MKRLRLGFYLLLTCLGVFSSVLHAQDRLQPAQLEDIKALAEQGNSEAQFALGLTYFEESQLESKYQKQAFHWIQKAAQQGHAAAMNALGGFYEAAIGTKKDDSMAFSWYERSAQAGFALGQLNVSECYEKGRGTQVDAQRSIYWLQQAAEQGFPPAQALFGWRFEAGQGVDKDERAAAQWYLKAAQGDLVRAMSRLAFLYYSGKGVPVDYRRAEAWYRRAARSKDPIACNDLAWFLVACPDARYHAAEEAIELSSYVLESIEQEDFQFIDTMAAALARKGDYGNAVQAQTKAILALEREKKAPHLGLDHASIKQLDEELKQRLLLYREQKPYQDKAPTQENAFRPLMDDRILQEEERPRRPRRTRPTETEHVEIS